MIKYLFTTRGGGASKIISEFTREKGQKRKDTPAHMSIQFFGTVLLESRLRTNVHLTYWGVEKKKVRVVRCYKRVDPFTIDEALELLKDLLKKSYSLKYDKMGVAYIGWRRFLKRYFKKPIPVKNKFDNPNRYFCNELWELEKDGVESSMLSPNDTMLKMSKDARYERCEA